MKRLLGFKTKKLVTGFVLLSAMTLAGCVAFDDLRKPLPGTEAMLTQSSDILRKTPDIVRIPLPEGAFELEDLELYIPANRDVYIDVEFADARLDQIIYSVAKDSGIGAVYYANTQYDSGASSMNSNTDKTKRLSIAFKGRISDFLNAISKSSGIFVTYENNTIVARETSQFSFPIPAYGDVMSDVSKNIVALGGDEVAFDRVTSSLSFSADMNAYNRIKAFLTRLQENAALVTMQVVVMNVKLSDGHTRGIDWSKMAWQHGLMNTGVAANSAGSAGSITVDGDGGIAVGGNAVKNALDWGSQLTFNSTGAGFLYSAADFSMQALLNFMESQGRYEIMQNFFTQTMSGAKGTLDVLTETPYVSGISIASIGTNVATTAQTANTDTAKQGVQMTVTPFYAKGEGILSIQLDVSVLGVTRFLTLDAGLQLGKLTQPETTRKTVNSFVRMVPSQVAVLGGMVYDRTSIDASGLPGSSYLTKSVNRNTEKEELVIVVKPTVIEFVSPQPQQNQKTKN